MMQRFLGKYKPFDAITKGCRVELRGPSGQLASKGWRISTSCSTMASRMNRPCTCNRKYRHAVCEGKFTGESAYYTKDFARHVCKAILDGESTQDIYHALTTCSPSPSNDDENDGGTAAMVAATFGATADVHCDDDGDGHIGGDGDAGDDDNRCTPQ